MCWISDCDLYCVSTAICADAGIDAIRQHEIDDAEFAAEGRGRFAAMFGEGFEAFAAAARHDYRQRSAGQTADVASGVGAGSVSH